MLTRKRLRELHGNELPLHVLEQDYIQALFLLELYRITDKLAFKGGTCLKHVHGLDRYSEDLDFTLIEDLDIGDTFTRTAGKIGIYGIEASCEDHILTDISFSARLRYMGPLFNGSPLSRGTIRLEVSLRDDIMMDPKWKRGFLPYPEVRVLNLLSLTRSEMMAEKLRALAMRRKARDLYDIWFLLNQGVEMSKDLFAEKMKRVNLEDKLTIKIDDKDWRRDLASILTNPPDFRSIKDEVLENIETAGIEIING